MKKFFSVFKKCLFATALFLPAGYASEPALRIASESQEKVFSRSELLKRKDLEWVSTKDDPAYPGREMKYRAVKLTSLFAGIPINDDAVIQFKALDGFSAPVSRQRLLNESPKESTAYIAIEEPGKKWPPLGPGKPSAGPFYLVWKNPELSHIGPEEWPYMLAAFEVKGTLREVYPALFPDPKLKADHPVNRGFEVFVKNCFACHTLNKAGASQIGPDLNLPMNPTEYFQEKQLLRFIRDPQSLRHWPNSRMSGFDSAQISDRDLDALLRYLKHMAGRKVK